MSAIHTAIVVILIGLGDSLNPATIGPAMYLATVDHPRRRLTEFLVGFVGVNLLGGLIVMLGPGELVLGLVPKPRPTARNIIEVVAGVALLVIAVLLWSGRRALGRRKPPSSGANKRTGVVLGAGIAVVELPTALPYYAAIAVIVGSGLSIPSMVLMLVLFNVAFVAPVLGILLALVILGDSVREPLARVHRWILKHWPGVLAVIAALAGAALLALGVSGLVSE
jgi:cytochrome c biogenesis protein CcdA